MYPYWNPYKYLDLKWKSRFWWCSDSWHHFHSFGVFEKSSIELHDSSNRL